MVCDQSLKDVAGHYLLEHLGEDKAIMCDPLEEFH